MPLNHLADWFNRVGLVLGYGSFLLAAPEFIGEERLKALEGFLISGLRTFRLVVDAVIIPVLTVSLLVFPLWRLAHHHGFRHSEPFPIVVAIDVAFVLVWLLDKLLKWFVPLMARKEGVRRMSFLLGAALFTASFVLQFAATLDYFK